MVLGGNFSLFRKNLISELDQEETPHFCFAVNLHYLCMVEPAEDGNLFGSDSDSSDGSDSSDSCDSVECSLPVAAAASAAAAAAAAAASAAAVATVDTPDAKKEEDGGGVPPPPAHELTKRSSVISAEEGKEGKEDGSGNKEEPVLGAASAQAARTTHQASTDTAVLAAVPRKELPVDEEAKARHTGKYVRSIKSGRSKWVRSEFVLCTYVMLLLVVG